MKFNFIKSTVIFTIFGLFIPGFTAIIIIGFQMLLSNFGVDCPMAWKIIWTITIIGGLALPFLFYRHIKNVTFDSLKAIKIRLTFFNLLEYIFIQSSLIPIFTSVNTLCFAGDGQNGLELVFTAWLSLPFLIIFSVIFNKKIKLKMNQSQK